MLPAEIKVEFDEKQLNKLINEKLNEQMQRTLLFIDAKGLSEITSFSLRFLEDEILCDPRMKLLERRKHRKRFWIYKESIEVIKEIVNSW